MLHRTFYFRTETRFASLLLPTFCPNTNLVVITCFRAKGLGFFPHTLTYVFVLPEHFDICVLGQRPRECLVLIRSPFIFLNMQGAKEVGAHKASNIAKWATLSDGLVII